MRRIQYIAILLVCVAAGSCGEPTGPSSTAPPLTSPTGTPPTSPPSPLPRTTTYTVSGLVKEAWIDTGVPGATVSIASGPSFGSTVTDEQGRYSLANLLPGVYTLTFSKPVLYPSRGTSPVSVFADETVNGGLSLSSVSPATAANLQGYWVAQGPYPHEPSWILLIQNGTRLEGWYKDDRDYSTGMSGTYTGDTMSLDVGVSGIKIEGRVHDARCIRAFIKNEALGGGNFPVTMSRGGNCSG